MNNNNFELLAEQLANFGFEIDNLLTQSLEALMGRGLTEFELFTEAFFALGTKIEAKLYFISTGTPGFYHFVKYRALLCYAGQPGKDRAHTFYLRGGHRITFRDAFTILHGRTVCTTLSNPPRE